MSSSDTPVLLLVAIACSCFAISFGVFYVRERMLTAERRLLRHGFTGSMRGVTGADALARRANAVEGGRVLSAVRS